MKQFSAVLPHLPHLIMTHHAERRCIQRNIHISDLQHIIDYGHGSHRQNMRFFTVKKSELPHELDHKSADKLSRLVVVMDLVQPLIITAYYQARPYKHIRKKNKKINLDHVSGTQKTQYLKHRHFR
ncbi:hypothetical protein [Persicobacter psychrovividus]|uniref:Uncharacterized protein n=1 Tax=Persicobacter psychrovividus TaxID=387638 RepID=A0ABM7VIU2_9BACT|nr:hypothetical protein PEPS_31510 [Persicobacter psychrovividus]